MHRSISEDKTAVICSITKVIIIFRNVTIFGSIECNQAPICFRGQVQSKFRDVLTTQS